MLKLSFFSYKGGSGRTTTLFNTLPFLAEKLHASAEHPIVIFDMDYRSAGITILLSDGQTFEIPNEDTAVLSQGQKHGLQYLISNNPKCGRRLADFKAVFAESVGNKLGLDDNDAVLLVGANMQYTMAVRSEKDVISILKYYMDNSLIGASAIIFDSPSGTQVTANVSISRSDVVVCCMRPSFQFRQTTMKYLTSAVDQYAETDTKKRFVLTMTAVPVKDMVIDGRYQISTSHQDVMNTVYTLNRNAWIKNPARPQSNPIIDTDMIIDRNNLGIREIERFKWNEKVNLYSIKKAGKETLSENEEKALSRYEALAKAIVKEQ